MFKYFLGLILFFGFFTLDAQTQDVQVFKDPKIDYLVEKQIATNKTKETEEGYRIQVLLSNTRDEVKTVKVKFYQDYPDLRSYIIYDQPYYKLRVGNFKNRIEATKCLNEIINKYQTAYIVKDEISIKD